jgi:hypothetical protein
MELIIELGKLLWAKSDPMLIVCILILGYWQRDTRKKLDGHLNPDPKANPYPHPQCKLHEDWIGDIKDHLGRQHDETITGIAALSERIDRALERK